MSEESVIAAEKIDALYKRLDEEAEASGYHLNPDREFTQGLVEGLLINKERYGYPACPCRLATGDKQQDLDIICPCDYRDADLNEYGACYCALYVSEKIALGHNEVEPVPERRGTEPEPAVDDHEEEVAGFPGSGVRVWRCRVCGYLCARPQPPLKCPICKVDKDRFERFA